jgi:hypothetical protein
MNDELNNLELRWPSTFVLHLYGRPQPVQMGSVIIEMEDGVVGVSVNYRKGAVTHDELPVGLQRKGQQQHDERA